MTRQIHGGYYGQEREKVTAGTAHIHRGQIAAMLNIGRTTAYQLVKQEEFRIVRIGNAIRVSKKSFDEWLESLEL